MATYTNDQIEVWKQKAEKWDKLGKEIAAFYLDENGNELEEGGGGDLADIGEVAAISYGWL